jgi:hypothetical protein
MLGTRSQQENALAMNIPANSISNGVNWPTTQVGQESMREYQIQETSTATEDQSSSKQASTRMYKYLVVGTLKDNSDVLVYARGRKQRNVDREKIKLSITEEATRQNSLDLSKPFQDQVSLSPY